MNTGNGAKVAIFLLTAGIVLWTIFHYLSNILINNKPLSNVATFIYLYSAAMYVHTHYPVHCLPMWHTSWFGERSDTECSLNILVTGDPKLHT